MKKLSEAMVRMLTRVAREQGGFGIVDHWMVNSNSAVALLNRGLIVSNRGRHYQLTAIGGSCSGVTLESIAEQAHEVALIENENFRRCPFANYDGEDGGRDCDFRAFGTSHHNSRIEADDQITYHVLMCHMPTGSALWVSSIRHLTDEHRSAVAKWLTRELRDAGRITDPNEAKFYAVGEYYQRGGYSYNLMAEVPQDRQLRADLAVARADGIALPVVPKLPIVELLEQAYAVDQPVDMAHCKRVDAHTTHVWSWLGPKPSHFCDGSAVDISEDRCRQAMRNHTPVYVEGAWGRIDDVAVLGGVKFHVTGVNDGWYHPSQITIEMNDRT